MKLTVTTNPLAEVDVDLLLFPVAEEKAKQRLRKLANEFGEALGRVEADFKGKAKDQVVAYPGKGRAKRVGLLGLGAGQELTLEKIRRTMTQGAQWAAQYKAARVGIVVPDTNLPGAEVSQAVVEGLLLAAYRFTRYKTEDANGFEGPEQLVLQTANEKKAIQQGADRGYVLAQATATARDLVNRSPDDKTATQFGQLVKRSAKTHGYRAEVWDKARIEEEEMGGLLAVNRGSVEPPTFSVLEWKPEEVQNDQPVVLVGKGVMFDTGGLSLKSTKGSMDKMKSDMAGAAAVVGALEAVARLELPLHVIGLIPATDNRPGGNAYVPGDVITMHSGTTVEVLNTDAEGRLILADALSYAQQLAPELVIDLATLTGAQLVALGTLAAAVLTPEDKDAEKRLRQLKAAGEHSGDRVEPLPMYEEYKEQLKSSVADIKNVGGRKAGTITAAKFLEHFVDYPWMHLDIAGPSFFDAASHYHPEGGTGYGVRLLADYLSHYVR